MFESVQQNHEILDRILDEDFFLPVLAIMAGTLIAIVAIIRGMVVARAKEQTKRELAAYVAEGTLDPDKAARMLAADRPWWERESPIKR